MKKKIECSTNGNIKLSLNEIHPNISSVLQSTVRDINLLRQNIFYSILFFVFCFVSIQFGVEPLLACLLAR